MDQDSGLRPAIAALVAGLIVIGSAIGLFLLLVGTPGGNDGEIEIRTQRAADDEPPSPPAASDDTSSDEERGPSLLERFAELLAGDEPPRCADVDACREPSPELLARYPDATACDWYELRICIVPLGDVPVDLLDHLVDYYATEYELEVRVLRPVSLDEGLDIERPGQVEADALRQYFSTRYFVYDRDLEAILIGLTPLDIYTAEVPEWRWFFGQTYGYLDEPLPNQAIISFYRMDPVTWGDSPDADLLNQRVRKLMNKYVGLTYYRLELSDDPDSVMYRLIGGLDALDRIDERIPLGPGP